MGCDLKIVMKDCYIETRYVDLFPATILIAYWESDTVRCIEIVIMSICEDCVNATIGRVRENMNTAIR